MYTTSLNTTKHGHTGAIMSDKSHLNRRQFIEATATTGVVVASGVSSQSSYGAEGDSDEIKLKFGVINDVHHTTIKHLLGPDIGEHSELIKAFALAMNAEGASFVVSNGDQVHEGHNGGVGSRYKEDEFAINLETYRDNMKLFKGPSYYVLGNHESCGSIGKEGIRSIWHHPDINQYMPANYFKFDYPEQKLRFIVLDSQCEPDGTDKQPLCTGYAEGYIPPAQMQWLRTQLDDARRNSYLAIIFNHQILGNIHYPYGLANGGEIQRLVGSYSDVLPVTLHGHLHGNHIQRENGVTYVSARRLIADLSADWAKQSGDWLLVEVFADNRIRIKGHGSALSLSV